MEIDDSGDTGDGRRLSIEKKPIIITDAIIDDEDDEPSAFERLPDEIIQQCV